MRRATSVGLLFLAIFALGAVMVDAAPAAEAELLTAGIIDTEDVGAATFESTGGGIVVKCTSSAGSIIAGSNSTGTFSELFKNCTAAGFKCTGAGDSTGTIHALGNATLIDVSFPELHAVVVFTLASTLEFSCLGVVTKVVGSVVGTLDNANAEKTGFITILIGGGGGKNTITEVNGTPYYLESRTGSSGYVQSSLNRDVSGSTSEVEVMY